jgi:hypothetical protein
MSRGSFVLPGRGEVAVRSNKTSYVHTGKNAVLDLADDEDDTAEIDAPVRCANSTGIFAPPYWSFVFSDIMLRDHVCVMVSMPSGLLDKHGLDGKVDATVSTCKHKLDIACEWPEAITKASCMQDALSVQWSTYDGQCSVRSGSASTVSNILQAFEKELRKVHIQNKVTANNMLGSTVKINLPFEVESDMVLCQPNLDRKYGSVILYIVLKKTLKKQDQFSVKKMSIRVSGDVPNKVTPRRPVENQYGDYTEPSQKKLKSYSPYVSGTNKKPYALPVPVARVPVTQPDPLYMDVDDDDSATPDEYYDNMPSKMT